MAETIPRSDLDSARRIEYSALAMEQIRERAKQGLMALPRTGMGVGGLLLGEIESERIRVFDSLEIQCSHTHGPSFRLNSAETDRAKELIANTPAVVGWYCSRTQGEATLTESDLALHRALFPEPGRLALVLRPSAADPMLAVFFSVGASGEPVKRFEREVDPWQAAPASHTNNVPEPPANVPHPAIAGSAQPEDNIQTEVDSIQTEAIPGFALPPDPAGRRSRAGWVLGLAGLALSAVAIYFGQNLWTPKPPLTLDSNESGGTLVIHWNAEAVRGIDHASMSVNDGGQLETLLLDRGQLDAGSLRYQPRSERVTAKLNAGGASAIAVWFKPAPAVAPPNPAEQHPPDEAAGQVSQGVRRRYYRSSRKAREISPAPDTNPDR